MSLETYAEHDTLGHAWHESHLAWGASHIERETPKLQLAFEPFTLSVVHKLMLSASNRIASVNSFHDSNFVAQLGYQFVLKSCILYTQMLTTMWETKSFNQFSQNKSKSSKALKARVEDNKLKIS